MSVEQSEELGKATWRMRGRVKLRKEVHVRNARSRIRDILMACHVNLNLNPSANLAFDDVLRQLSVQPDAEPLSGEETNWWTPENLRELLLSAAAAAATTSGRQLLDDEVAAVAGGHAGGPLPGRTPTWAFNGGGPHRCTGGGPHRCECAAGAGESEGGASSSASFPVAPPVVPSESMNPGDIYPAIPSFPGRGERFWVDGLLGIWDAGRGGGGVGGGGLGRDGLGTGTPQASHD